MLTQEEVNLELIKDFYTNRSRLFSHKSCGWSDAEQQIKRFEQLAKLLPCENYSLNDFGCGDGSFLGYLVEHKKAPSKYRGYDLIEKNVSKTNFLASQTGLDAAAIHSSEFAEISDYTVASGTFSVMLGNRRDAWGAYIEEALEDIARNSRYGFGINFLSKSVFEPGLYVTNIEKWRSFCSRLGNVEVIENYLPDDFTLLVHKLNKGE